MDAEQTPSKQQHNTRTYQWKPANDATFFPGRQVSNCCCAASVDGTSVASALTGHTPETVQCSLRTAQAAVFATDMTGQSVSAGMFGIIHPEVLAHFDIGYPVAALELNLHPFL